MQSNVPARPFAVIQRGAFLVGAAAGAISVIGALFAPESFFRAYLFAFLFWLGVSLGCMALLMIQYLTGGRWGFLIRRTLEAATQCLPMLGLLFIPLLFGMRFLFVWTHPDVMQSDPELQRKASFYLNTFWFVARACVYFACWIGMGTLLRLWSLRQDRGAEARLNTRIQLFCGPGLAVYVFTVSFAAIDWIMSLEPHWSSTIFGMIVICGQGLVGLAFAIVVAALLARREALGEAAAPEVFQDLGHLLLAFVLLWTYMAFSQFLIIWSGNLAREVTWYVRRNNGGWQLISVLLSLFHFAIPFVLLLFGGLKRRAGVLAGVAAGLLLMHLLDVYWMVAPSFSPKLTVGWMDGGMVLGIGGIWIGLFVWHLQRAPLLPLHDARHEAAVQAKEASAHG